MSKKIIWNNNINSIKSFFKYLLLSWKEKGIYEKSYEQGELYNEYCDYCLSVDLDYFSQNIFSRTLNSLGVESKVVWDELKQYPKKVRTLTLDSIMSFIGNYEDDFFVETKIVNLNGATYLLTTKLKRIEMPKNEGIIENFNKLLNQDIIDQQYDGQSTTTEQQPSSPTAGGDSCEA